MCAQFCADGYGSDCIYVKKHDVMPVNKVEQGKLFLLRVLVNLKGIVI